MAGPFCIHRLHIRGAVCAPASIRPRRSPLPCRCCALHGRGTRIHSPGFLLHVAAEALEVLDVRQDDLVSGADPLSGKRLYAEGDEDAQ
jgi:hypothetical protein